jgi:hypothetical protein
VLAPGRRTRAALGHLEADEGAFQGRAGGNEIRGLDQTAFEDLLRLPAGPLGAGDVDLGSHVGRLRKNYDSIGADLEESAEDGELLLFRTFPETKHALSEQRNQGRMMRQDAERAFAAGHDDFVDVALEGPPLWSDYL